MAKRIFKTKPGPIKGTHYPDRWRSGPDPERRAKYLQWLQQRNQAQWRGEHWELEFDDWLAAWGDLYEKRGRAADQYCMTREDADLDWTLDNVIVLTRREHYQRNQHMSVKSRMQNPNGYKGYKNGKKD